MIRLKSLCKFSEYAKETFILHDPNKIGEVIGISRDNEAYRIRWIGRSSIQVFHKSFIDIIFIKPKIKKNETNNTS